MGNIVDSFRIILDKQKELNYHFPNIIRPPATSQDIATTERSLSLFFNSELKELYSFADGTEIDTVTPCGLTGLIPIHNFLSLEDATHYYYQSMEFPDSFHNWTRNFRPGNQLFPFLEDGAGNCYWVDLNEGTTDCGRIFWTNTFGTDPDYTYESLTDMFEIIAKAYLTGIMFVGEDGYLDCDFDAFDKLSNIK
ncbi:SMI1/KNR4 family protein [Sphingobacterium phlebotomi]|uniref:SMI1/KNR4 family protein n=1 Tax=Sphingobacterium phlebotomi TaxID=2605433 RepID=A0A5D4GTU7_9SPHI|nr:SMI1/KNR4 family protein [Sphingobacterium phlebotomi]TYR31199.1 SMI1/KNR4 family protein [Sphingobacterium phlebotomi]